MHSLGASIRQAFEIADTASQPVIRPHRPKEPASCDTHTGTRPANRSAHYEWPAAWRSWHDLHRYHGRWHRMHRLHWDFAATRSTTRSTDWRGALLSTALQRELSGAAHLPAKVQAPVPADQTRLAGRGGLAPSHASSWAVSRFRCSINGSLFSHLAIWKGRTSTVARRDAKWSGPQVRRGAMVIRLPGRGSWSCRGRRSGVAGH